VNYRISSENWDGKKMNIITNSHRALAEKSVSEQLNQMNRTVKAYLQLDSEEANEELTR
jgi:hypothetical protein